MCAIVGIASRTRVPARAWLAAARDSMRHRGPDDEGEWWTADGRVGFGHRRLAIIDLSPAGHQPMLDRTGELSIVFNGEIYNYRELRDELRARGQGFASQSDTEVILAAYREWGTRCPEKLHGMFAFAIYDARNRSVFLARDRAGEKPLFYAQNAAGLRFASELKALLLGGSLPRRIDPDALDCYLADGFVPGERCMLEGARKLPPAHALQMELESGQTRVWRYWHLPDPPADSRPADDCELLNELEAVLRDAVRRQLVADVPVGVLLSGGVDSSLITAMAAQTKPAVKTFTVRFTGHDALDETQHARLIARHFGTEHEEIDAEAIDVGLLPLLARQFDEPMIDSSMIPTFLLSKVVRKHCTVAVGGDGGDELFGGYPHYDRLLWMERTFGSVPRSARSTVARAAGEWLPVGFKGRNWLQGLSSDLSVDVPMIAQMFDLATRRKLMLAAGSEPGAAERIRSQRLPASGDLLQRSTRLDFENYLAEDILVKVDRASMLTSLEVRAPMLDARVIEFAYGKVPSRLKATQSQRKILLKQLAARLLPQGFDQQRKQGFSIPLSTWLRAGTWRDYFRAVLLDRQQTWFDHRLIERMLDGESRGRSNGERLFGLVMFELWRREYQIDMGGTHAAAAQGADAARAIEDRDRLNEAAARR